MAYHGHVSDSERSHNILAFLRCALSPAQTSLPSTSLSFGNETFSHKRCAMKNEDLFFGRRSALVDMTETLELRLQILDPNHVSGLPSRCCFFSFFSYVSLPLLSYSLFHYLLSHFCIFSSFSFLLAFVYMHVSICSDFSFFFFLPLLFLYIPFCFTFSFSTFRYFYHFFFYASFITSCTLHLPPFFLSFLLLSFCFLFTEFLRINTVLDFQLCYLIRSIEITNPIFSLLGRKKATNHILSDMTN